MPYDEICYQKITETVNLPTEGITVPLIEHKELKDGNYKHWFEIKNFEKEFWDSVNN